MPFARTSSAAATALVKGANDATFKFQHLTSCHTSSCCQLCQHIYTKTIRTVSQLFQAQN